MKRSFSQLQSYIACPKRYEFAYVKKLPRGGISAGESFGTSMHNALKRWGEIERDKGHKGDPEPVDRSGGLRYGAGKGDQLKLFMNDDEEPTEQKPLSLETLLYFWRQSFVVEGYPSRVEAQEAMLRGEKILELYFAWWQQAERQVVAVEKGFTLDVDGLRLAGRFDRIEAAADSLKVYDFKTSRPRNQTEVDADLQLSIYAIACEEVFKRPCASLSFLFLNPEGIQEISTTRTAEQLEAARQYIKTIDHEILSGHWQPTPGVEVCGRCAYKNVCPAAIK